MTWPRVASQNPGMVRDVSISVGQVDANLVLGVRNPAGKDDQ